MMITRQALSYACDKSRHQFAEACTSIFDEFYCLSKKVSIIASCSGINAIDVFSLKSVSDSLGIISWITGWGTSVVK